MSDSIEQEVVKQGKSSKKKKKGSNGLISTFFRNALRSNLDLTSLADTKAGILISINGFILTVSVTASSFTSHSQLMTFAFVSIILTSLGSIILAVLSVKPRTKNKLVKKEFLEGYESLLYYQDMADHSPDEYHQSMKSALKSSKRSIKEMTSHLHILGAEIKKKYFWLKYAYTYFSVGLILSASLIVYALIHETSIRNEKESNGVVTFGKFYNIFEPSGATTIDDNKVLVVEDESGSRSLKLVSFDEDNTPYEVEDFDVPKKLKKEFKKKIEDLEAIASNGHTVFAITSHSLNRSNERKKSREKLLMMRYENESIVDLKSYDYLRDDLMELSAELFGDTMFGYNHLNIEGLVYDTSKNSLILGLRAPTQNTKALLIEIKNPNKLYSSEPEKIKFGENIALQLGGLGVRALAYDMKQDGYWIVAGDSGKRISKFSLYFYTKATKELRQVSKDFHIGNTEGITIVQNGNEKFLFCVEDNGEKPNKAANYIKIDMSKL